MASLPRDLVNVPLGDGRTLRAEAEQPAELRDRPPEGLPGGRDADPGERRRGTARHPHPLLRDDRPGRLREDGRCGRRGRRRRQTRRSRTQVSRVSDHRSKGVTFEVGPQHLDGTHALAYARIRRSEGQTDFTRQARQQEILMALRAKVVQGGALFNLPSLLDAVGKTVATDLPAERLPDLARCWPARSAGGRDASGGPLPADPPGQARPSKYGASQAPELDRILAMADGLFPAPGTGRSAATPKPRSPRGEPEPGARTPAVRPRAPPGSEPEVGQALGHPSRRAGAVRDRVLLRRRTRRGSGRRAARRPARRSGRSRSRRSRAARARSGRDTCPGADQDRRPPRGRPGRAPPGPARRRSAHHAAPAAARRAPRGAWRCCRHRWRSGRRSAGSGRRARRRARRPRARNRRRAPAGRSRAARSAP